MSNHRTFGSSGGAGSVDQHGKVIFGINRRVCIGLLFTLLHELFELEYLFASPFSGHKNELKIGKIVSNT